MILNPFTLNSNGGSDSFKLKFSNYYENSGTKRINCDTYDIAPNLPAIVYVIPYVQDPSSSGVNQHIYQTVSYLPKVRSANGTLCVINGNGKGSSFASISYDIDDNMFQVTLFSVNYNCLIQVYQ